MDLKKINKPIVLTLLFSLFLFNISWTFGLYLETISKFLRGTFLESFRLIIEVITTLVLNALFYITIVFILGSIILIFVLFMVDILNKAPREN